MTSGFIKDHKLHSNFEKQMGCMAGFLHIFDRHHILAGKRLCSTKRLPPPSSVGDSASESEMSSPPSPAVELPHKSAVTLPVFEKTKSPWKSSKEAPRLSLDSRANMDAKGGLHPKPVVNRSRNLVEDVKNGGQQCRSPSVIAKLMGLEQLPDSSSPETDKTPELRRSASESRVSRDLFQSRFISDGSSFVKDNHPSIDADPRNNPLKKSGNAHQMFDEMKGGGGGGSVTNTTPWRAPQPRKTFFDSGDVFPEPKQSATMYGEIEKRIKFRGIDEPSKDLETLKHILEALQLKGLLHSKPPSQLRQRNFVYDDSPIVLMKPSRSPSSTPINRGVRRSYNVAGETPPSPSPRRDKNLRSPTRSGRIPSPNPNPNPNPTTRSNSPVKSKPFNMRRANESPAPVRSPKLNPRKTGSDRSDRTIKSKKTTSDIHEKEKITTIVITEDDYSSISGSSITTSTDTERWKGEELKEGKCSLLERCDRLLQSIAEMAAADMQPSPVSVLDSSFYKDDSFTPSPVTTKRNIGFKDQYGEYDEEIWSPVISPIRSKFIETSDDCDFLYVSDILRALHHLIEDSDAFLILEKQQYINGNDMSESSRLQRKLIFDTIYEIVGRSKRLPPWKATETTTLPPLDKVWSEFQRIRERETCEDLFESICSVLKKDLAGDAIHGWGNCHVEGSEVVLDIERLIFKDMVCEIIGDLSSSSMNMTRRKLVF